MLPRQIPFNGSRTSQSKRFWNRNDDDDDDDSSLRRIVRIYLHSLAHQDKVMLSPVTAILAMESVLRAASPFQGPPHSGTDPSAGPPPSETANGSSKGTRRAWHKRLRVAPPKDGLDERSTRLLPR